MMVPAFKKKHPRRTDFQNPAGWQSKATENCQGQSQGPGRHRMRGAPFRAPPPPPGQEAPCDLSESRVWASIWGMWAEVRLRSHCWRGKSRLGLPCSSPHVGCKPQRFHVKDHRAIVSPGPQMTLWIGALYWPETLPVELFCERAINCILLNCSPLESLLHWLGSSQQGEH